LANDIKAAEKNKIASKKELDKQLYRKYLYIISKCLNFIT